MHVKPWRPCAAVLVTAAFFYTAAAPLRNGFTAFPVAKEMLRKSHQGEFPQAR